MRTSLREIERIEHYLQGLGNIGDHLLLEAHAQLNPELAENMEAQSEIYRLVRAYGRQKVQEEISQIDAQLFDVDQPSSFLNKILSYFK